MTKTKDNKKAKTSQFTLEPLVEVMAKLRESGGCVWDIGQTHMSLRRYLVEEVYEVLEAIEEQDFEHLREELGDLLLQIVFHARMAEEDRKFSMQTKVIDAVIAKMVRRHPHVFGDILVQDAGEVLLNWEKIKKSERKGCEESVLAGVPKGLPSLMQAFKLQGKAAKVGFDWPTPEPVWDKVLEELAEFKAALESGKSDLAENELGDLLFSVVNLARVHGIEPEVALNAANNKFIRRFNHIESRVKMQKLIWDKLKLEQLDYWWEEAKALEEKNEKS